MCHPQSSHISNGISAIGPGDRVAVHLSVSLPPYKNNQRTMQRPTLARLLPSTQQRCVPAASPLTSSSSTRRTTTSSSATCTAAVATASTTGTSSPQMRRNLRSVNLLPHRPWRTPRANSLDRLCALPSLPFPSTPKRFELSHRMLQFVLEGKNYVGPVERVLSPAGRGDDREELRVLDLGTGGGLWCVRRRPGHTPA